jgi:hypothetical protein
MGDEPDGKHWLGELPAVKVVEAASADVHFEKYKETMSYERES